VIAHKKDKLTSALKMPPSIHQLKKTIQPKMLEDLHNLLKNYKPENRKERKERLLKGKLPTKPLFLKHGAKHVTELIEQKRAQLVLIAADVDPVEVILFIPSLCKRQNITFGIVESKNVLGAFVNKKKTSIICLEEPKGEDKEEFMRIKKDLDEEYLNAYDFAIKKWGNLNQN